MIHQSDCVRGVRPVNIEIESRFFSKTVIADRLDLRDGWTDLDDFLFFGIFKTSTDKNPVGFF